MLKKLLFLSTAIFSLSSVALGDSVVRPVRNLPPSLTTNIGSNYVQVEPGSNYDFLLIGSDPEGAWLTYYCTANCVDMVLNQSTGYVSLRPRRQGYYNMTFAVSDGYQTTYRNLQVDYRHNGGGYPPPPPPPPPPRNLPPSLSDNVGGNQIYVNANQYYSFMLIGRDPEGRRLTYGCYRNCVGVSVNRNTGRVDILNQTSGNIAYNMTFGVTDGVHTTYKTYYVYFY